MDLTLRDGGSSVATAHLNKVAMGTNLSQVEIDAIIDEITSCSPLMDGCLMFAVGLVPGFGLPVQLISFQNAVCKMNYHWERGNTWKAGGALFRALLAPLGTAVGAAYGVGSMQDLLVRGGRAVQNCGTDMLNALSGPGFDSRSSAIDSLAAETAVSMEFEYSAELFAEGDVTLHVGVEGYWTSEDTLSINEAVVFPVFAGDFRWAHVGPEPVPVGTGGENPLSAFEAEIAAKGAGPLEFGLLQFVPPDSSAWIRFKTIPMDEHSVARISICDTTTVYELYLDRDGDGRDDEIWHTDGTMETIYHTGVPGYSQSSNFLTTSPNPMMGGTTLRYGLLKAGSIELVVYDLTGRRKATLLIGSAGEEVQSLTWNGTDDNGRRLPAGVYLVRLTTDTGVLTRKIVLTR
ncbi:MAG: T9SS type A sorting domain-containing protein [Deltaproteobacteria bacterium]|nr:T9SS type A sorting domain-containing protein [Deltaproteobacteria bacterium]